MSSREQPLVIGSPFRTGFYAGLGFFFASVLMSEIGLGIILLLGIVTAGSLVTRSTSDSSPSPAAQPAAHHVNHN